MKQHLWQVGVRGGQGRDAVEGTGFAGVVDRHDGGSQLTAVLHLCNPSKVTSLTIVTLAPRMYLNTLGLEVQERARMLSAGTACCFCPSIRPSICDQRKDD